MRESVQRSEAGIGEEPQEEDEGTEASEGGRAAAQGPPIEGYDSMNVEQISNRLEGLSVEELEQLRRYEAANKDRSTLRRRIACRGSQATGEDPIQSRRGFLDFAMRS